MSASSQDQRKSKNALVSEVGKLRAELVSLRDQYSRTLLDGCLPNSSSE